MQEITALLKNEAKRLGFCDVGVADAGFSISSAKRLLKRERRAGPTPFVSRDITKRVTPKKNAAWSESVIVVTYPFERTRSIIKKPKDGYLRGRISRVAWGEDYHKVVFNKLAELGEELLKKNLITIYKPFVDAIPLCERELALRSGIGSVGKNNALISSRGGSFVFIGGLLIDEWMPRGPVWPFQGEIIEESVCTGCYCCIDNCPGGALDDDYTLNYERCISYLTVKKGYIPLSLRPIMQDYVYGCDRCLEVCPRNFTVERKTYERKIEPDYFEEIGINYVFPRLEFLLGLSKTGFKNYFSNTALFWRGKTVIQRNAAVVLGNLKDPRGADLLLNVLREKGEIVAAHALWSIGRLYSGLSKQKKMKVRRELLEFRAQRKDIWTWNLEHEYEKVLKKVGCLE